MTAARALRVLIVDDEPLARRRVADLLGDEEGVEIVGTAASGDEAVASIRTYAPDVVFLDVEMPDGTGLKVVRRIGPEAMPVTVFVTAYNQYALQAFDAAAVDYLVKPYDDDRFAQALRRARQMVGAASVRQLSAQLMATLQAFQGDAGGAAPPMAAADRVAPAAESSPRPEYLERIAVELRGQVRVVPVSKVQYITASGPYVEIHTADRTHLVREQMQVLEERLDPERFVRLHRSAIVRLDLIESLRKNSSGDYTVQLRGGLEMKVSRSRSEELERKLGLAK